MGFFGKPSGREIDLFAKKLAADLAKRYPPEMDNPKTDGEENENSSRSISEKRLTRLLEDTYQQALVFRDEHSLGFYKKARLGNTFRWELDDLGYSKAFIDVAVEGLVVYLSRRKAVQHS